MIRFANARYDALPFGYTVAGAVLENEKLIGAFQVTESGSVEVVTFDPSRYLEVTALNLPELVAAAETKWVTVYDDTATTLSTEERTVLRKDEAGRLWETKGTAAPVAVWWVWGQAFPSKRELVKKFGAEVAAVYRKCAGKK